MTENEFCSCEIIHQDTVREVAAGLCARDEYVALASLFKLFGDGTRVKILHALELHEMCVCDLAALLGVTKSAVSHQLRVLKQSKLVKFRREGKTIFYSLADDHVRTIIGMGMEHLCE